jgi:hypothetical protein
MLALQQSIALLYQLLANKWFRASANSPFPLSVTLIVSAIAIFSANFLAPHGVIVSVIAARAS